jgi:predicted TIM-barrel fold metal-dependent hydrolase
MRCDAHVHIVGAADRYPQLPTRTYLAGVAPLDDLRRAASARGVTRFVIVQPSFYGNDNTLTLESLDTLGGAGRGVAVVDPAAVTRAMLEDYAARGVRGLRLNLHTVLEGQAAQRLDLAFAPTAEIAQTMGWHVQVITAIGGLIANAEILARAKVPVVVDHYGLYGSARPRSGEGRRLLDLLGLPHVWTKLSAPYRVSEDSLDTRPDPAWLTAILERAGDRCVWGSDWPHTPAREVHKGAAVPTPYRNLSYARLVDDFIAVLPDAAYAERIMRDNPARLYGF